MSPRPIPLGLYVHIPFCLSRCGYCTFVSSPYDADTADAYIDALGEELERRALFSSAEPPSTIFVGGGTPSCLSPRQIEKLLALLPLPALEESTVEINPDSCTPEKLRLLKDAGITRLSFGVQTFSKKGLDLLERRHDSRTAIYAIESARKIGFPSINVDLIGAWPGQDLGDLKNDMSITSDLMIQHISIYSIIIEEDARCYTKFRSLLESGGDGDDRERRYWDFSEEFLENKGFKHYETSNFSQAGHTCRHNVRIWKGGEYLGVGAAAHSHIEGRRFANYPDIGKYIKRILYGNSCESFTEMLSPMEKARECAVFWWRLFEGINLAEFRKRTGYDLFALYREELPSLLAQGIMEMNQQNTHLRVGKTYHPLLDAVLADLV